LQCTDYAVNTLGMSAPAQEELNNDAQEASDNWEAPPPAEDEELELELPEEAPLLGFLEEPYHPLSLLAAQFPSKCGGRPAWLNPRDLPAGADLACGRCERRLRFLLQLYAPFTDYTHAFHRAMFVFICPNAECWSATNAESDDSESKEAFLTAPHVRVFRSQLPRENPFYSSDPPTELEEEPYSNKKKPKLLAILDQPHEGVNLCVLCGCSGESRCGRCKKASYCSKQHQQVDWKLGHSELCEAPLAEPSSSDAATTLPTTHTQGKKEKKREVLHVDRNVLYKEDAAALALEWKRDETLFVEKEIVIEQEEIKESGNYGATAHEERLIKNYKQEMDRMSTEEQVKEQEAFLGDANGWSSKLHTTKTDPYFLHFSTMVSFNPDQVVRYHRDKSTKHDRKTQQENQEDDERPYEPLWHRSGHRIVRPEQVAPCPRCKGPRVFEFQIMPQMVYFLDVDACDDSWDFGMIVVYSCAKSCAAGDGVTDGYMEEFAVVQPCFEMKSEPKEYVLA
jgi:pre-rRNA-processing protein TSR4